jgi:signal peptidase II
MHKVAAFKNTGLFWLWVALIVVLLDRLSKTWVMHHLLPGESIQVLPIFNLTLAYNTGAAFSFLHSASGWQNGVLGAFAVITAIVVVIWLYRLPMRERWLNLSLCLILGGALGNLWDRILYGKVIDFFDFYISTWHFAIFNVADSAITVGACMMLLDWVRKR